MTAIAIMHTGSNITFLEYFSLNGKFFDSRNLRNELEPAKNFLCFMSETVVIVTIGNAELDFNLADAVRVNERITMATCRGK